MYLFIKRLLDILISLVALIIVSPLFIIVIPLLRFTGEGEVFYFQQRMGYKNTPFQIWKFATMLKNSPNMGTGTITLRNDPRVTTVGHILRMTKVNELPQLFNVLLGDMSIVGPRPLMPKDFEHYPESVKPIIYQSKPGITGIGSIVFRDEQDYVSRADISPVEFYKRFIIPYKGELEVWYQQHASVLTDLLLMFLTAWVILFPKSMLVYRIFKDLPERPAPLDPRIQGTIHVKEA
ncbi:MAG: sugar transferase [Phaeodactylibacter sp.]|nr:sugar transferase [Phaeodactylibacter sp.]